MRFRNPQFNDSCLSRFSALLSQYEYGMWIPTTAMVPTSVFRISHSTCLRSSTRATEESDGHDTRGSRIDSSLCSSSRPKHRLHTPIVCHTCYTMSQQFISRLINHLVNVSRSVVKELASSSQNDVVCGRLTIARPLLRSNRKS